VVSTTPTDPGLMPEIRPGENMLLALPGDAAGLARTIAPLANNPALRQTLATGARQLGQLFEWEQIAKKTFDFYQNVLQS
jgi:glycosyltransferase involved in cell wall biosynthesis